MATIINKRTPEIIASRRALGIDYITVRDKELYFPKQTAFKLGIDTKSYIHFINDGNYWAFFINDDVDGFQVTYDKGYKICNRTLTRLFIRSTKQHIGDRFYIVPTKSEHNSRKIWEIYTAEPVDIVIEKQKRISEQKRYVLSLTKQEVKKQKNAEAYDGK